MLGFQRAVGAGPAPAVVGDFASANVWTSVDAGPGGLVSGKQGLRMGRFAWISTEQVDPNAAPAIANNFGIGPVAGFVHREQIGLNTLFLQENGMLLPPGFACTLLSSGDFWVYNDGNTEALYGMKAFARYADGAVLFAPAGATPPGGDAVTATIAPATAHVTGSIDGDVLTVTAVADGIVAEGSAIAGTGIAAGTTVTHRLAVNDDGTGTYRVSIPEQTVASTAITVTYGIMTVTAGSDVDMGRGDLVTGTGVTAGTKVTGVNADGTFNVAPSQTVASATLIAAGSIETKWSAMSAGAPGELVKISSHVLG